MSQRPRPVLIIAILAAAVTTTVAAVAWQRPAERPAERPAKVTVATSGYLTELTDLNQRLTMLDRRAQAMPTSWMAREQLAQAYLDRARLTGVYDDYSRAQGEIDASFAIAPPGAGPFTTRASLAFAIHRFDTIAGDLAVAERALSVNDEELAGLRALRAQAAYHRGDYDQAEADYAESLRLKRDWSTLCGKALLRATTGDPDTGDRMYQMARSMAVTATPRQLAWLDLQRGLLALARGRYADAETSYRSADAVFPGWWVIEEHLAEIAALQGRRDEARERYRELIERTGNPEFMDALAEILREDGDQAGASALTQRATAAFADLIAEHPAAATGHALDHFIASDPQPDLAVRLAELNRDQRAGGAALTALIEAYLAAGRHEQALATARQLLATRWDTADGHAAASRALAACGEVASARTQARRARELNPLIEIEPTLLVD
ncbi:MAG: hypothetical protein H0W78_12145 [Planctomycetes bacterium]|nr:hypothetical protein [Planctomycetota bacterium]